MIGFEFEHQAMNNEPLPDGLSMEDQLLYLCLRNLYASFRSRAIAKEQGAEEKGKLLYEHGRRIRLRDLRLKGSKHTAAMWASIGRYTAEYRKERTLENADKLLGAIEGHVHKWEEFDNGKN